MISMSKSPQTDVQENRERDRAIRMQDREKGSQRLKRRRERGGDSLIDQAESSPPLSIFSHGKVKKERRKTRREDEVPDPGPPLTRSREGTKKKEKTRRV